MNRRTIVLIAAAVAAVILLAPNVLKWVGGGIGGGAPAAAPIYVPWNFLQGLDISPAEIISGGLIPEGLAKRLREKYCGVGLTACTALPGGPLYFPTGTAPTAAVTATPTATVRPTRTATPVVVRPMGSGETWLPAAGALVDLSYANVHVRVGDKEVLGLRAVYGSCPHCRPETFLAEVPISGTFTIKPGDLVMNNCLLLGREANVVLTGKDNEGFERSFEVSLGGETERDFCSASPDYEAEFWTATRWDGRTVLRKFAVQKIESRTILQFRLLEMLVLQPGSGNLLPAPTPTPTATVTKPAAKTPTRIPTRR